MNWRKNNLSNFAALTIGRKILKKIHWSHAILVVSPSIWILQNWPALLSPDSIDSLNQIKTGQFSNWHPTTFTILIKLISFNGQYIFLVPIFQSILMVLIFKYFFAITDPKGNISTQNIMIGVAFIFPFIGAMATTIWKDILYTQFLILGVIIFFSHYRFKNIYAVLAVSVGSACRHEGILFLVIFILIIIIYKFIYRHFDIKNLVKLLGASIFICFTLTHAINSLTNSAPVPQWVNKYVILSDIGFSYAKNIKVFEKSQTKYLDLLFSHMKNDELGRCESAGYVVNSPNFDVKLINNQAVDIWLHLLSKHPKLIFEAHACRAAAFIPPPFSVGPKYVYWINNGITTPNILNLKSEPKPITIDVIQNWRSAWNYKSSLNFLQWPGLLVLIIFLYANSFKYRESRDLVLTLSALEIARSILLFLITPGQDLRYAFPIHIVFTLFSMLAVISIISKARIKLKN